MPNNMWFETYLNLNNLYSNSHFKSKRYDYILHSLRLSQILKRCSTLMLCDLCTQSWLAHACWKRSVLYSFSMRPPAVHQCLARLNILITAVRVMLWLLSMSFSDLQQMHTWQITQLNISYVNFMRLPSKQVFKLSLQRELNLTQS